VGGTCGTNGGEDCSENLIAPGIEPGTSESVVRNSDHQTTEAVLSHGTCHKVVSDDLDVACLTQHSVPLILMQD
jgi:hypothetical protein